MLTQDQVTFIDRFIVAYQRVLALSELEQMLYFKRPPEVVSKLAEGLDVADDFWVKIANAMRTPNDKDQPIHLAIRELPQYAVLKELALSYLSAERHAKHAKREVVLSEPTTDRYVETREFVLSMLSMLGARSDFDAHIEAFTKDREVQDFLEDVACVINRYEQRGNMGEFVRRLNEWCLNRV